MHLSICAPTRKSFHCGVFSPKCLAPKSSSTTRQVQTLSHLDSLRCAHVLRPASLHGWLRALLVCRSAQTATSDLTNSTNFSPFGVLSMFFVETSLSARREKRQAFRFTRAKHPTLVRIRHLSCSENLVSIVILPRSPYLFFKMQLTPKSREGFLRTLSEKFVAATRARREFIITLPFCYENGVRGHALAYFRDLERGGHC